MVKVKGQGGSNLSRNNKQIVAAPVTLGQVRVSKGPSIRPSKTGGLLVSHVNIYLMLLHSPHQLLIM